MTVPAQLVLPIASDENHNFGNFIDLSNPGLLAYLRSALARHTAELYNEYEGIILWGETGVGKTHLLSAAGRFLQAQGGRALYLQPDTQILHATADAPRVPVYLLDELEGFIGTPEAEQALLSMLEGIKRQNALLIMTSRHAAKGLGIDLLDLLSRLQALDSFEVHGLEDEQKKEVIRQRAYGRGIVLSDEVLNWLFTHTSRDLGMLLDLLDRIDIHSLSQQRKVTIPLVKSMLSA